MNNLLQNPKAVAMAILEGIIPSLLWLWFWLKEDKEDPEPSGLITFCFIIGMTLVIFAIPIQKFVQSLVSSNELQIIFWAAIEEILKYLAVILILYKTKYLHKPIDWPIFLITVALGFAAFENILFLIKPLLLNQATVSLMTGQLRYLGSTLLHTVSSGIIGISIGLSFYKCNAKKNLYLFIGILSAIALHSGFNFFIMNNNGSDFLKVFAFLWVATIINLLLFEKLRRISSKN
ncbi:MAG TPA: PrsW family glutamic-type intramembrane protease [Candidatus Paceibacterota bacterium]|nr:PrsW family glutamic-type intramembrane protease [Candidatus Paceibacterota bacterium]HPT17853.1 PrsW family glutamic-type intramembrane protease [Candidatus Paceibacterota bacterium]